MVKKTAGKMFDGRLAELLNSWRAIGWDTFFE